MTGTAATVLSDNGSGRPGGLDQGVFLAVNAFARHTPWLHAPAKAYAAYGVVVFAGLLVGGWWQARRSGRPEAVAALGWAPIAAVAALAINQLIMRYVAQGHPSSVLPRIPMPADRNFGFLFPSSHATVAGAAAAGLWLAHRRLGTWTALAAVAMVFCRVYIAASYPSDALVGLILGAVTTGVGYFLFEEQLTWLIGRLASTPLHCLVTTGDSEPVGGPTVRVR